MTNIITGLVAVLYSISFFLGEFSNGNKSLIWIKHYSFAFLLSAFWAVPFVLKSVYSNSAFIPFVFNSIFFISILACCLILIYLYYKEDASLVHASLFLALMLIFIFLVHLFEFGFHAYRLAPFLYIFMILVLCKAIKTKKVFIYFALAFLVFSLIFYCNYTMIDKKYESPLHVDGEGRSLIVTTFTNGVNVHLLEHLIPVWNPKIEGVSYIYVESALNAKEVNTLKKLIAPNGLVWGTTWNLQSISKIPDLQKDSLFDRAADLFGLTSIITYSESSAIDYVSKSLLFTDRIKLWHMVYQADGEIFYSEGPGFFISKKTGKIYLVNGENMERFNVDSNSKSDLFYKDDILRDVAVLCDDEKFYFLKKNPELDFNSYSYSVKTIEDIQTISNEEGLLCVDGKEFPINSDKSYVSYSGIPMIKINDKEQLEMKFGSETLWDMNYYIYALNQSFGNKVEILNENVSFLAMNEKNWKDFSFNWFLGENYSQLYARGEMPDGFVQPNGQGEIENLSFERERVRFYVKSEGNMKKAVLVKVSYFPNWKAYENGKQIKIYEVSPHLMMVYASGEVEFRYEPVWSDWLGEIGSFIGFIWLLWIIFKWGKNENK